MLRFLTFLLIECSEYLVWHRCPDNISTNGSSDYFHRFSSNEIIAYEIEQEYSSTVQDPKPLSYLFTFFASNFANIWQIYVITMSQQPFSCAVGHFLHGDTQPTNRNLFNSNFFVCVRGVWWVRATNCGDLVPWPAHFQFPLWNCGDVRNSRNVLIQRLWQ